MTINARTKLLGLFGWPVEHSLSPEMHNRAFRQLGLNYAYLALPVKPEALEDAVRAVRALDMRGVNVTVPHKEKVIPFLDELDPEARFIGAVNTVVNTGGKLKGHNTDGRGFIFSLKEEKVEYEGRDIVIIGAGGACRAVSYYLSEKAGSLSIFDIDRAKLEKLVSDLGSIRGNVRAIHSLAGAEDTDIVINATPLGLHAEDPLPVETSRLKPHTAVVDLIYRETPLLKKAAAAGHKTLSGLGMLLWQGVLASELWTGIRPPHDIMRKALEEGLGAK